MTATDQRHPWDNEIDAGFGWTDQLVSHWDGIAVFVTRNIDGPEEQAEAMRLVFPDGSRLYIGTDASNVTYDDTHWTEYPESDAMRVFGPWVKALYERSSITEMDTDI